LVLQQRLSTRWVAAQLTRAARAHKRGCPTPCACTHTGFCVDTHPHRGFHCWRLLGGRHRCRYRRLPAWTAAASVFRRDSCKRSENS
jgi:hypothetical protein